MAAVINAVGTGNLLSAMATAFAAVGTWKAPTGLYVSGWFTPADGDGSQVRSTFVFKSVNGPWGSVYGTSTYSNLTHDTIVVYTDDSGTHTFTVNQNGQVISGQAAAQELQNDITGNPSNMMASDDGADMSYGSVVYVGPPPAEN